VRSGSVFAFSATASGVYLYVPGLAGVPIRESEPGGLMLPHSTTPLLQAMAAMPGPFTAADLPDCFTEGTRLATLRKLLLEGALELVSDSTLVKRP
jgi:hypothetical protein